MNSYSRKFFCESTLQELEDKINEFEKEHIVTDLYTTVRSINNSPSGVLFLASLVYKN